MVHTLHQYNVPVNLSSTATGDTQMTEGVVELSTELDRDNGEEEKSRTLVVRAQDGDWIMGEDLVLPVSGKETVVEIEEVQYCIFLCIHFVSERLLTFVL